MQATCEAVNFTIEGMLFYNKNQMRQRYFSPDNLTQSQQYTFTPETKPEKRLRSNGSVTTMVSYPVSNTFDDDSDIIGHYRIDFKKQIGSGYSSKVYKGVSLKDSQQVAVKVLNIKKLSASSLQMLEAEINILRRMNHQNIMKCYDVYKTTTQCYIVTQYCPMGDLQKYMTRKGIFEEKQAIDIITQVSQGVKYFLKNGIIHRDLKPANILQGKTHWKIADFGFAIESQDEITTKHNVGTPLYMPPEALIKNLYSPQSDIFAIGIILYEMVVGVTPWECSSERELIRRLTSLPLKIPSKARISLSTKHLLQKLCSVQISERMTKDEFLSLNFNNFNSLDMLNVTYSKKILNTNTISKKKIALQDNKKSQTKSKSKQKMLIKVTSKDTLIKPKASGDTSLLKSKAAVKQKSSIKLRQIQSGKGINEYQIIQEIKSPKKNRKRSVDSSLTIKRKKSTSKPIQTQKNLEYHNGCNETILSSSIYQSSQSMASCQHPTLPSTKSKKAQKVENKFDQKLMTLNYRVIISQLDYCRFMYYLVRNLHHFNASEQTRQKTGLGIFKHLIKLIKLLADCKNNWFGFMNWESWKKTQKYIHTQDIVLDYMRRYQKQYLSYFKGIQIGIVRQTNQKLNEISNIQPFSINIYQKILAFVSPFIRESSQNLNSLIPSQLTQLYKKTQAQVEALSSVIKYYKLVEMSIKEFQNFVYFEQNSQLYFLKDFTESAANAAMYFKLKDDIKLL